MSKSKLPPELSAYFAKIGARGGKVGGAVRAARMTPEELSKAGRKAVQARWARVRQDAKRQERPARRGR